MPAIACFGFVDTSRATAAYVLKHKRALVESGNERHHGVSYLDLVRDGEDDPILADWKSMASLLHRAKTVLDQGRGARLINAYVQAVAPLGIIHWGEDETPDGVNFARVHLCLLPSPDAWVMSGNERAVLLVGVPTFIGHSGLTAEVNFDPQHSVHKLVMEFDLGSDA